MSLYGLTNYFRQLLGSAFNTATVYLVLCKLKVSRESLETPVS